MKRPLLGIIIVMCLQLGFTAYIAIDRPIEAMFAVNEITSGTNPVVNMPDGLNNPDLTVSTINKRTNKGAGQTILFSSKKDIRASSVTGVNRIAQYTVMQKPLESTVITYPGVVRISAESKPSQPVAGVVPRVEKRSFASKSVAVLKKPYEWLRAFGSRIN